MWIKFILSFLKPTRRFLFPVFKYLLIFIAGIVLFWMMNRYSLLSDLEESLGLRDDQAKVLYEVNKDDRVQKEKNQKRRRDAEKTAKQREDINDRAPAAIRDYLNKLLP